MKSKEDIEKRLKKLGARHLHKYIQNSQERKHLNCMFNESHRTYDLPYGKTQFTDVSMSPRRQETLIVISEKSETTRLCMYESKDPKKWAGLTCDSDDIAMSCNMFKPKVDPETAKDYFFKLVSNDEYVFNNQRDVATLQWVLGLRVYDVKLSLLERFMLWIVCKFSSVDKPKQLLEDISNDLTEDT